MNPKPRITRLASYGVVLKDSRILLCRLSEQIRDRQGWWTLPGGGVDFGEHPEEGMIREVHEETGLAVRSDGLLGVDSITRESESDEFHGVRIIYRTALIGGTLRYEQNGTTDMCSWHDLDDLPNLKMVDLVETALALLAEGGA